MLKAKLKAGFVNNIHAGTIDGVEDIDIVYKTFLQMRMFLSHISLSQHKLITAGIGIINPGNIMSS